MEKPKDDEVNKPWIVVGCNCEGACDLCDGFGWYYKNTATGGHLSEMMRDALERHG